MTYPNAHDGVKKIRTAEILILLTAVIGIVIAIMTAVAANSKATEGTFAGIGVLALVAGILAIVAFIVNLIGLNKASKDDPNFKTALTMTFVAIILALASSIFANNSLVNGLVDTVGDILNLFIMMCVVRGIMSLAITLGREDMVKKGNNILKRAVIVYAIAVVVGFVATLLQNNATVVTIAGILLLIAAILDVIVYITYFMYLGKAVIMLEK